MLSSPASVSLVGRLVVAMALLLPTATAFTVCGLSNDNNRVYRYSGSGNKWDQIGNAAKDIYGGYFGLVATTPNNDAAYRWTPSDGWQQIGGGGAEFVSTNNAIYGLTSKKDAVVRWISGQNWETIGGGADRIFGGNGDRLIATSPGNSEAWLFSGNAGDWQKIGAGGVQFTVNEFNDIFALGNGQSSTWRWTGRGTDWTQIGGGAGKIMAGQNILHAAEPHFTEIYGYKISSDSWSQEGGGAQDYASWGVTLYGLTPNGSTVYSKTDTGSWGSIGGDFGSGLTKIVVCP